jgi:hypothetical protein
MLSQATSSPTALTVLPAGSSARNYSFNVSVLVADALQASVQATASVRVIPYVVDAGMSMADAATSLLSSSGDSQATTALVGAFAASLNDAAVDSINGTAEENAAALAAASQARSVLASSLLGLIALASQSDTAGIDPTLAQGINAVTAVPSLIQCCVCG